MFFTTVKALHEAARPVIDAGKEFTAELAMYCSVGKNDARLRFQIAVLWDAPENQPENALAYVSYEHPFELVILQNGLQQVFCSALLKVSVDMLSTLKGARPFNATEHLQAQQGTLVHLLVKAPTLQKGERYIIYLPLSIMAQQIGRDVSMQMNLDAGTMILSGTGEDMTFGEALLVALEALLHAALPAGEVVDLLPDAGRQPPQR